MGAGSYICVVDLDRGTGEVKIRRFVAVDDCGNIINPMIMDGQIHGGLTQGMAPALLEQITCDEDGNIAAGDRERGRRGARPPGRPPRRDPDQPRPRVEDPEGEGVAL